MGRTDPGDADGAAGDAEVAQLRARVAELTARNAQLEEFERAYTTLVTQSTRPVLIFDGESGAVLEANHAAELVFGRTRAELLTLDARSLSAKPMPAQLPEQLRAGTQTARRFTWHAATSPTPTWFDVSTLPLKLNARALVFALLTDASDRQNLAAHAREVVDRHLGLLEISPDAVVISIHARIEYANPAAVKLWGAAHADDLVGLSVFDAIDPEFHDELRARLKSASHLGQQFPRFEHRIRRLDGTTREVESLAVMVSYHGQLGRQTILRDVAERRAREEALVASEQRYRTVVEVTTDTVFELEEAGPDQVRLLWCTPSYTRSTGFAPGRVLGWAEHVHVVGEANAGRVLQLLAAALAGECVSEDFEISGSSGRVVTLHLRPSATTPPGAPQRIVGFGRDITAVRRAAEALARSEERYRTIASATSDFVYEFVLYPSGELDMVWISDAGAAVLGITSGTRTTLDQWIAATHPDDAAQVREKVRRLREGETDEREYRLRTADGREHWVRTLDRPSGPPDAAGNVRVLGAGKDVTSLREAQARQAALETELRRAREDLERSLLSHLEFGAKPRAVVRHGSEGDTAPQNYFGSSEAMRQVRELAEIAAGHDAPVLITGETGTGKGHLAQWMHDRGPFHARPFVSLNCSTLRGELLASELFGHARGAFTSAVRDRRGLIEEADGGTLFLDEIGEVDLPVQAQLLKVLEEKTFRRLGDTSVRRSSFRLVCATNRDLGRSAREGRFREDLYFRINVFPIALPALRERRDDLPGLITHLLRSLDIPVERLPASTVAFLLRYDWPGNIRELRNALIRGRLLAGDGLILPQHFPGFEPAMVPDGGEEPASATLGLSPALDRDTFLTRYRALNAQFRGNRSQIARALGVSRMTLYRYLQRFGEA